MFLLVFEAAAYSQSTYPVQAFDTVYGNNSFNFTSQYVGDIRSGEERAAFNVDYNINEHSSHPKYDDFIELEMNKILDNLRLDDAGKFEQIQELINKMKSKLENDVLLGNKNVNDIINF